MAPASPVPPPRPRLKSADLPLDQPLSESVAARLSRQMLEQIEALETASAELKKTAAKAEDVQALGRKIDEVQAAGAERDAQLFSKLDKIDRGQGVATTTAGAARYWAKVVAMASVAGPTLVIAFAHWGVANPGAFGGLAGSIGLAILAVAKATTPPGAPPSGSSPPPEHT